MLNTGTSTKPNSGSDDISQQLQLSAQLRGLTDQISRIERLLETFTNGKACIKKVYKACATSTAGSPAQDDCALKPVPNRISAATKSKPCPEALEPTKTQAPGNSDSGSSSHPMADPNDSIMIGNPQHGIYVSQSSMDKIPSEKAKNYALMLFELLFSREEAGASSTEGRGEQLKKLEPKRMYALRERTRQQFPTKTIKLG